MNEGMYLGIRNYLEEIAGQNKQILAELKRINISAPQHAEPDAFIAAVTQDTVSKKADSKPQTAATVEKQLEAETGHDFVKTGNDPVTLAESDKPAPGVAATTPGTKKGKKGGTVTPQVNWNS